MPSVLFLAFGNRYGGHSATVFVVMDLKAVGISILQRQAADDTRSAKACGSGLEMFVLLQHFQFRDNSLTVADTVVGNGEDQRTGIIPGHRQMNVEGILHGGGDAVLDGVFHQGLQDQIWDQTILQFLGAIYGKFQRNGGDHIGKLDIFRCQADLFRNGIVFLVVVAQIPPQIPAGIDGELFHFLDAAAGCQHIDGCHDVAQKMGYYGYRRFKKRYGNHGYCRKT